MSSLSRVVAATCAVILVVLAAGCAPRVPERPRAPQERPAVLLPPPGEAVPGERPEPLTGRPPPAPISERPAPPAPVPPSRAAPPPVAAAPLAPVPEGEVAAEPEPAPPAVTLVPPPGVHETVAVGLLLPLSGRHAEIGAAMLDAAQMAVFDIGTQAFTLLPRDTKGTPEGARKAARDLLDEGARILLGPLLATSVAAVAPEARAALVPVVAFSTDRTVAGDGVFVMGLLPHEQVGRVVSFARSRGHLRFAALAPNSPYGSTVVAALKDAAAANGAVVTQVEIYDPAGDVSELVRRLANYATRRSALESQIRELEARDDEVSRQAMRRLQEMETLGEVGFDAIFIPEGGDRLRAIAPLLPYYDIDPARVQILGTGQWDDPSLGTEPALVGGWFAAPPPDARADFVARFTDLYGHPPHRLATLAYDATALAAVLAQGENGPDFSIDALTSEQGFAGVDGIFRFLPQGYAQRGLAILEMHRNRLQVVNPAPEAFPRLIY